MNDRDLRQQNQELGRRLVALERRLAGIPQRFSRGGAAAVAAESLPTGTLTGQVEQMVTDNTTAWQFPVAHSIE